MCITFEKLKDVEHKHVLPMGLMLSPIQTEKKILESMDEDTYEELVASWAFSCLDEYSDCYRIGGAGDHGIDVLAIVSNTPKIVDIYQCKHYDKPLGASTVLPEVCKILYHVFTKEIPMPRFYFIVAPKSLSTTLIKSLDNPNSIKMRILKDWGNLSKKITNTTIQLSEELKNFIDTFDFSKFRYVSADKFLTSLRKNKHLYFQYFGVRQALIERIDMTAPKDVQAGEMTYVKHLLDAYSESLSSEIALSNIVGTKYESHFSRARDSFWKAESLRKMSEENTPGERDEFDEFKRDMHMHVADVYEDEYENGIKRNRAVLDCAKTMLPKQNRIIYGEIGPIERMGTCYHLSNDNKLIWVQK